MCFLFRMVSEIDLFHCTVAKLLIREIYYVLHQYSKTSMMHFLFNVLRIKGLYVFRALLADPQEVQHKQHLVYCVSVMLVGCYQDWNGATAPLHKVGSSVMTANILTTFYDQVFNNNNKCPIQTEPCNQ
jgi:hypothetical protein